MQNRTYLTNCSNLGQSMVPWAVRFSTGGTVIFTFDLIETYLTDQEIDSFRDCLAENELEENVWRIFGALFQSATKYTKPLLLKVYENGELFGLTVILKCTKYGKALFKNRLMATLFNGLGMPLLLWVKIGCCMDMLSCPGLVRDPSRTHEVHAAMARFLESRGNAIVIMDYSNNGALYPQATTLPCLPHALIDTSQMSRIEDFTGIHKNIRRKMRKFSNKGGTYQIKQRTFPKEYLSELEKCFISTADKSVFYLPYQDLYLESAKTTGLKDIPEVYYFIARLNGEFIGYQAAIKTGKYLNGLHGAFDRERSSNYHAYDLLFVKMAEFAIEHGLHAIDLGVVLNETKAKMVNKTIEMSYYLMSKSALLKWFLGRIFRVTRMQSEEQMKFR